MIKAIIFDFFDVIRQDAFHAWMRNHGFTRDDAPGDVSRRLDTGVISADEFFVELAQISGQSVDEVREEFEANKNFDPNVIECIKELKSTYKLGLLSNSDGDYLRGELKRSGLEDVFDVVLISGDIGFAKPDKEIFDLMLEKLGVKPEETLFIDDQQKNIVAAAELGIRGIVFQDAEQFKRELKKLLD